MMISPYFSRFTRSAQSSRLGLLLLMIAGLSPILGGCTQPAQSSNLLLKPTTDKPILYMDEEATLSWSIQTPAGTAVDNANLTFEWRQITPESPVGTFSDVAQNPLQQRWLAPQVSTATTFTLQVVAIDSAGLRSPPQSMNLTVQPKNPNAQVVLSSLTANKAPIESEGVALQAGVSMALEAQANILGDLDGQLLQYHWSQTPALGTFSQPDKASTVWLAPSNAEPGQIVTLTLKASHPGALQAQSRSFQVKLSPVDSKTAPLIIATEPIKGATDVDPAATLRITFSKALQAETVNDVSFKLYEESNFPEEATEIEITLSSDFRTVILTPQNALPGQHTFLVYVSKELKDSDGNAFAGENWKFSTNSGALKVSKTLPAGGAFGVALDQKIGITFSRPIAVSEAAGHITISPATPGMWSLSSDELTVTFQPTAGTWPLFQQKYTVTIDQDINSNDDRALDEDYTFEFTTKPAAAFNGAAQRLNGTGNVGALFTKYCASCHAAAGPHQNSFDWADVMRWGPDYLDKGSNALVQKLSGSYSAPGNFGGTQMPPLTALQPTLEERGRMIRYAQTAPLYWDEDIKPLIQLSCAGCHDGITARGGAGTSNFNDYAQVKAFNASNSNKVQTVLTSDHRGWAGSGAHQTTSKMIRTWITNGLPQ